MTYTDVTLVAWQITKKNLSNDKKTNQTNHKTVKCIVMFPFFFSNISVWVSFTWLNI